MQLNVVLLPEPFGPMRPRISPSSSSNETLFTARKAPNLLVRPETLSMGMGRDSVFGLCPARDAAHQRCIADVGPRLAPTLPSPASGGGIREGTGPGSA